MPWSDLAVLLGIVTATAFWARLLRRRGFGGGRFAVSAAVAFLGLVLIVTMIAHCLDVLSRLVIGTSYDGTPFSYSFRAYSLLLLGAVLISSGLRLLRISLALAARTAEVRRQAVRAVATVLVLVAPLIPIQGFFAIPLSLLGGMSLLLVLWRTQQADPDPDPVIRSLRQQVERVED